MHPALRVTATYAAVFILFSALYFLLFHTPLLRSQDVLFYRGVELLAAALFIFAVGAVLLYWYGVMANAETLAAALIASAAIHLALFVIFPVTFDRSVTMYLLYTLESLPQSSSCEGLPQSDLEKKFIEEYVYERGAVERRIKEQEKISTLKAVNQCVSLTPRGGRFLSFSRFVEKLYGVAPHK